MRRVGGTVANVMERLSGGTNRMGLFLTPPQPVKLTLKALGLKERSREMFSLPNRRVTLTLQVCLILLRPGPILEVKARATVALLKTSLSEA